jgi:hypothetical protein
VATPCRNYILRSGDAAHLLVPNRRRRASTAAMPTAAVPRQDRTSCAPPHQHQRPPSTAALFFSPSERNAASDNEPPSPPPPLCHCRAAPCRAPSNADGNTQASDSSNRADPSHASCPVPAGRSLGSAPLCRPYPSHPARCNRSKGVGVGREVEVGEEKGLRGGWGINHRFAVGSLNDDRLHRAGRHVHRRADASQPPSTGDHRIRSKPCPV